MKNENVTERVSPRLLETPAVSSTCSEMAYNTFGMCLRVRSATLIVCVLSLLLCCTETAASPIRTAGCHRVGYQKTISEHGCPPTEVKINVCAGYCESYSIPSDISTLIANPNHIFTVRASCCSMEEHELVSVELPCTDGMRVLTFRSATTCTCSTCRFR